MVETTAIEMRKPILYKSMRLRKGRQRIVKRIPAGMVYLRCLWYNQLCLGILGKGTSHKRIVEAHVVALSSFKGANMSSRTIEALRCQGKANTLQARKAGMWSWEWVESAIGKAGFWQKSCS